MAFWWVSGLAIPLRYEQWRSLLALREAYIGVGAFAVRRNQSKLFDITCDETAINEVHVLD